jgi:hypothetical protein
MFIFVKMEDGRFIAIIQKLINIYSYETRTFDRYGRGDL